MKISQCALASVCAAASLFLSAHEAVAQAANGTTSEFLPIEDYVYIHPCTSDFITFNGRIHLVTHYTELDGRVLLSGETNYAIFGVGTSGTVYKIIESTAGHNVFTFLGGTGAQDVQTGTDNVRLITPGSGREFTLHSTFHHTTNPDGTTTVSFGGVEVECP